MMQNLESLTANIAHGRGYVLLPELFSPEKISKARSHHLIYTSDRHDGL